MRISFAIPAGPDAAGYTVLAEELGYHRVWFFDSPALYGDVYVALAEAARRTTRIGLGTGVLIPSLRHPMAQAAAIATIERLAPGRFAAGLGTGFTGRLAMGQKPLTWAYMRRYLRQLKALLAGETVEIDGAMTRMIHPDGFSAPRPIDVPIIVGANGPKGLEVARELGDGIICLLAPQAGFDWCTVFQFGTVLDDGEELTSPRVLEAVGPGLAVYYHSALVDRLARGDAWKRMIEQEPEASRHLKTHELHMVALSDHDRPFVDPTEAKQLTFTGTVDELRERLAAMESAGASEIAYAPMGPDVPRELRAFARMAGVAAAV